MCRIPTNRPQTSYTPISPPLMNMYVHIFSDVSVYLSFFTPMCKPKTELHPHWGGTEEAPTRVNCDALRAGVQRKSRLVFPLRCISICGVLETLIYVCSLGLQQKRQMSKIWGAFTVCWFHSGKYTNWRKQTASKEMFNFHSNIDVLGKCSTVLCLMNYLPLDKSDFHKQPH